MENTNISEKHRQELLSLCEQVRASGTIEPHEVALLENFISSVRYGLRFEKHEERVDRELRDNFPVFIDVTDKEICCKPGDKFNFLLEGDNLHSLKLLEKTHKGRIDVIYIDPPYNTGNEFVYNDKIVGRDDGYRHSKWLSFMAERLSIAHQLLSDRGVIFISIDDNEQANLKLLCDNIFGEENFLPMVSRISKRSSNNGNYFSPCVDYILSYTKKENGPKNFIVSLTDDIKKRYKKVDEFVEQRGPYQEIGLFQSALKHGGSRYPIECPDGSFVITPDGKPWRWNESTFHKNKNDGFVVFKKTKTSPLLNCNSDGDELGSTSCWNIYTKSYLYEREESGLTPKTFQEGFQNNLGTSALKKIGVNFDFAKPVELVKFLVEIASYKDSVVLDFFAGSGTTGQAVLELNEEDGGNRQFILCTNNENNICEDITYQRLKTVIAGIRQDGSTYSEGISANLKYFKCGLINREMEDVDDALMEMATSLIELENHIDASDSSIVIVYDEEELDELLDNFDDRIKHIYVSSDIATTGKQEQFLAARKVQITEIPHHYYKEV